MSDPHVHSVLLVDDYADGRDALGFYMECVGVTAVGVGSGEEALARLATGWRPCGVVADLTMPDMDGWTLVGRIRRSPRDSPTSRSSSSPDAIPTRCR